MTIYTIIEAPHTLPHEGGSPQAVACEVASTWLGIDIPLEHLRAIENDSKYKTFAALNESELCTVFVDQERVDVWGRGLQSVAGSIQEHQYAVWEIERGLATATDQLANIARTAAVDEKAKRAFTRVVQQARSVGMEDLIDTYMGCLETYFDVQLKQRGAELMP